MSTSNGTVAEPRLSKRGGGEADSRLKELLTRLRDEEGCEFFLNSKLEPTIKIPDDPFRQEWPADGQRVQDILVSRYDELTGGRMLRAGERDHLLSLIREECRQGGRRLTEVEAEETDWDIIVRAILRLMNDEAAHSGRTLELLRRLRRLQNEGAIPRTPPLPEFVNNFSRRINRLIPALRGYGVDAVLTHKEDGSHCTLTRLPNFEVNVGSEPSVPDGTNLQGAEESSAASSRSGRSLPDTDDADAEIRVDAPDAKRQLNLPSVVSPKRSGSANSGTSTEGGER